MKIAIIGSGIAGNTAAYHLSQHHEITLFEKNSYVGGHTHTHEIDWRGDHQTIDSGFIVFNKKTYPNFLNLINAMNVEYQPTQMSFSVKCERTGLEYNGTTLNSLFAQRRNLFNPKFYRMIVEIIRFNRESLSLLSEKESCISLGDYLENNNYSHKFINQYIVPMGAAIWSTDHQSMFAFPAKFFVQFFHNHGMLNINERPQWYVIKGGSKSYLEPMLKNYRENIRTNAKVERIVRYSDRVSVYSNGQRDDFDYLFLACHSDEALSILESPTSLENQVLSAIPYSHNRAILHTDSSILPKRKLAWAAWNYHLESKQTNKVALTYNMNILQSLKSQHTYCLSLNYDQNIDDSKIIRSMEYYHPFFTQKGIEAQSKHSDINGTLRTFYCGAYWRNGFHEDGVVSSLKAIEDFNKHLLENGDEKFGGKIDTQQDLLRSRSA